MCHGYYMFSSPLLQLRIHVTWHVLLVYPSFMTFSHVKAFDPIFRHSISITLIFQPFFCFCSFRLDHFRLRRNNINNFSFGIKLFSSVRLIRFHVLIISFFGSTIFPFIYTNIKHTKLFKKI